MLNQVKANSKNPQTFYWCLSDGPVLFHCIDDLVFDTHAKKCITERQQKKQQKSRDKRGSKVSVTPLSADNQSQNDKKSSAQESPQDKKSTSSYYFSSLYPFPSRYIPSQPNVPLTGVALQAPSPDSAEFLPDCPVPQFGRDAPLILIPSPDYCDEFFSCSNSQAIRFTCPKDTDFNSKLRVCDHVRNIKCASGKRRRDLVKQDETAVPRVAPSSPLISSSTSPSSSAPKN